MDCWVSRNIAGESLEWLGKYWGACYKSCAEIPEFQSLGSCSIKIWNSLSKLISLYCSQLQNVRAFTTMLEVDIQTVSGK